MFRQILSNSGPILMLQSNTYLLKLKHCVLGKTPSLKFERECRPKRVKKVTVTERLNSWAYSSSYVLIEQLFKVLCLGANANLSLGC